jgi:hypothetical protein
VTTKKRQARAFGRRYAISWDAAAGRFQVTLGAESIGAHATHDGAVAIAAAHARCTTLASLNRQPVYSIETIGAPAE